MDEVIITLAITYLGLSILDIIERVKEISKSKPVYFNKTN